MPVAWPAMRIGSLPLPVGELDLACSFSFLRVFLHVIQIFIWRPSWSIVDLDISVNFLLACIFLLNSMVIRRCGSRMCCSVRVEKNLKPSDGQSNDENKETLELKKYQHSYAI